jgi:23S rRNA pseudouridine2605 synthase
MPIGRLDFNTEGLLLLTNDGGLKRAMELPSSGIPRTYRARAFGAVTQAQLEALMEGIEIDGMRYGRIDANMERSAGRNQWIEMTITEGKNREVRRVLEHLGLEVSRLIRTAYGPFQLLDLPRGAAVEIRQVEVERFVKGLRTGAPPAASASGTPADRAAARPRPGAPRGNRRPAPANTSRSPAPKAGGFKPRGPKR